MDRRKAIATLGVAAAAGLKAAPSVQDRFPGIYKLNSWKQTNRDGSITEPLGPSPIGRITYHKSGYMSAILMRPDRKPLPRIDPQTATMEELREAVRSLQSASSAFITYMGTYTIDEAKSHVIHHLEGGSSPTFIATDFVRQYEFYSKGLYLSVPPQLNAKLEWERIADA